MFRKIVPRFNYLLDPFIYLNFKYLFYPNQKKGVASATDKIFFYNARSALKFLLESISVKRAVVAVQLYTCETVFHAISLAGYSIVFIDIDQNLKLNRNDLVAKKNSFDILIVTHTFGFPEDIDEIRKIVGNEVIIIEDCCHSYLTKVSNNYDSGCQGDAAFFSLGVAKFPPIGIGGYIKVNNFKKFLLYNEKYLQLKTHTNKLLNFTSLIIIHVKSILFLNLIYNYITSIFIMHFAKKVGFTNKGSFYQYLAPPWVVEIFKANTNLFADMRVKQTKNFKMLYDLINCKSIIPLNCDINNVNGYLFPIIVHGQEELAAELRKTGYHVGMHFQNCVSWGLRYGYVEGSCPVTEDITKMILTLPVHPRVLNIHLSNMAAIINLNEIYL